MKPVVGRVPPCTYGGQEHPSQLRPCQLVPFHGLSITDTVQRGVFEGGQGALLRGGRPCRQAGLPTS